MNIKELITTIKNKLEEKIVIQDLKIEDKSFLHKKHKGYIEGKFHLKLTLKSEELNKVNKIDSNKKIYNILNFEIKHYIHSIQIIIN
ncbi:BolA/IbaG family iron-sulfur metabolism protein [Candidatus Pelagibacter sp.]|jgi:BolA family transcriptional regulator, general stress-responsive regulator|nr:BolA/IbaG family iron-sulfur metabolism protein [Candidatus Pelagibacter sp.]|tara:strand:- start:147 stop:407 length:261 start_codon:yes stop_codon:yes gene_type:complete